MLRTNDASLYRIGHPIDLQIVDWFEADEVDPVSDDDVREDSGATTATDLKYVVKLFCVDKVGGSVSLNLVNYEPYFYVQCKNKSIDNITALQLKMLESQLSEALCRRSGANAVWLRREMLQPMVGFSNMERMQYIKVRVANLTLFYRARKLLQGARMWSVGVKKTRFELFESNITPMLRLMHLRNLSPTSWIRVEQWDIEENLIETCCTRNLTTDWRCVAPVASPVIAPLQCLSFDLECTSSHGDFPMAVKTYVKTANQLVDLYNRHSDIHSRELKQLITDQLRSVFDQGTDQISRVYPKRKLEPRSVEMHMNALLDVIDEIVDILKGVRNVVKTEQEPPCSVAARLTTILDRIFPKLHGDPIIQIGTTVHKYGDSDCVFKHVLTLGTCDAIEGVEVVQCDTERELIERWCELLREIDPDVVTGYNILGFDFDYLYNRASELGVEWCLRACGRIPDVPAKFVVKELASSALGDNTLKYLHMDGRVIVDLMKVVQRDHKLDSYKLDHVANHFIHGKVLEVVSPCVVRVDRVFGVVKGNYIVIDQTKHRILGCGENRCITLDAPVSESAAAWGLAKDDVSPAQIFQCQQGSASDRALVAKYCVQDCALCNLLIVKLDILANNIGMSNVCSVPLSYIFMRGQGIKIFSLVAKQCMRDEMIMPVLKHDADADNAEEEGYEGAIVLDPIPGIYVNEPVSVMDYASLYPSSMISENISHDSIVLDPQYDNLPGVEYVDVSYDIYQGKGSAKTVTGVKTCRFAQWKTKGILPRILMHLLAQRKLTRKRMQHQEVTTVDGRTLRGALAEDRTSVTLDDGTRCEVAPSDIAKVVNRYSEFELAVLDGLQLAYKITANSLYGQVGAPTSPIYLKELAASTTATGRNLIMLAKRFMEENYDAKTVYGDTDSVFVDFRTHAKYGLSGRDAVAKSIELACEASQRFKQLLKAPHDLEYEKTFWPFIILSKKKYIGNLYEHDVNKFKQKGMGIVLKRRDNANILKIVYGGIIDILLNKQDVEEALRFLTASIKDIVDERFPLEDLIITKTLRSTYADPTRIAHKVLAERMRSRDPGSAPQSNDRIPYVYIQHDRANKALLQGDKIEHPDYVRQMRLKPDLEFYISNQLQNPISQLMSLVLERIPGFNPSIFAATLAKKTSKLTDPTAKQKLLGTVREQEARRLLFFRPLSIIENRRRGIKEITSFFRPTHTN